MKDLAEKVGLPVTLREIGADRNKIPAWAAAAFKELLKAKQPDVEFVTEQATPLGKVDAGAVAQAIDDAKPDGIFNVLFGGDLAKFVREGSTRGVFKNRTVVSLLSGEPEYP